MALLNIQGALRVASTREESSCLSAGFWSKGSARAVDDAASSIGQMPRILYVVVLCDCSHDAQPLALIGLLDAIVCS